MTKMRKDRDGNLVPLGSQARPPRLTGRQIFATFDQCDPFDQFDPFDPR